MSPVRTSSPARPAPAHPAKRANTTAGAGAGFANGRKPASHSVDHWTMVLFYAAGVGALALALLFFLVLAGVGLYGQLVWTFTQWDLSSVRSEVVKPWAQLTLWTVFLCGTSVGVWFFGGYAWQNLNQRMNNAATRRRR